MLRIIPTSENEFAGHWRQLLARDRYRNPLLSGLPATVRARQSSDGAAPRPATSDSDHCANTCDAGMADATPRYDEHSFIIANNDQPLLGCAITSHTNAHGQRCLGYRGNVASIVVNRESLEKATNNFSDSTVAITQKHMRRLLRDLMPAQLEFMDPVHFGLLSPVTHTLLEHGGMPQVSTSHVINLQLDLEQLYAAIAPDYQALITWRSANASAIKEIHGENSLRCLQAPSDKDELLAIMHAWGHEFAQKPAQHSIASSIIAAQHKPQLLWQLLTELLVGKQGFVVTRNEVLLDHSLEQMDQPAALFVHNGQRCYFVMANAASHSDSQAALLQLLWRAMGFAQDIGCKEFALEGPGLGQANGQGREKQAGQSTTSGLQVEQFGGVPQASMRVSWS